MPQPRTVAPTSGVHARECLVRARAVCASPYRRSACTCARARACECACVVVCVRVRACERVCVIVCARLKCGTRPVPDVLVRAVHVVRPEDDVVQPKHLVRRREVQLERILADAVPLSHQERPVPIDSVPIGDPSVPVRNRMVSQRIRIIGTVIRSAMAAHALPRAQARTRTCRWRLCGTVRCGPVDHRTKQRGRQGSDGQKGVRRSELSSHRCAGQSQPWLWANGRTGPPVAGLCPP